MELKSSGQIWTSSQDIGVNVRNNEKFLGQLMKSLKGFESTLEVLNFLKFLEKLGWDTSISYTMETAKYGILVTPKKYT